MTRRCNLRSRTGPALAAALLALTAGCQSARPGTPATATAARPPLAGRPAPAPEPSPRITAAQEADVQIALARSAEAQGDVDAALAGYEQALTRDRQRADALLRIAILRDKQGQFAESEAAYRQALKLRPGDAEVFSNFGYSLYLQRRWAEAEQALAQAVAIQPQNARAQNNLGLVLARSGRPDAALAAFRAGGNSRGQAHCNLAFALAVDGQLAEARDQYRQALAAEPGQALAQQRLRELDAIAGRLPGSPAEAARDGQLQRTAGTPTPALPAPAPRR